MTSEPASSTTPPRADDRLLLRIADVQRRLSVGRSTVYQLMAQSELRPIHIGTALRFLASEVEDWVSRQVAAREVHR